MAKAKRVKQTDPVITAWVEDDVSYGATPDGTRPVWLAATAHTDTNTATIWAARP